MTVHAFTDPVFDAQKVFRAAMNVLSRPGTLVPLEADVRPPAPLSLEIAALALAFADHETPIWLDAALTSVSYVGEYLKFHTGAPITPHPVEAAFALVSEPGLCPSLTSFTAGTADYPDRSTTIFVQTDTLRSSRSFTLRGPGVSGTAALRADPLPPAFPREWAANRALFPRGVDMLFAADGWIAGLPRSTELSEA